MKDEELPVKLIYCAGYSPLMDLDCRRRGDCVKHKNFMQHRAKYGSLKGKFTHPIMHESMGAKCGFYEEVENEYLQG